MVDFIDIANANPSEIQKGLARITDSVIAMALIKSPPNIARLILGNISKRRIESVKAEFPNLAGVDDESINAARGKILREVLNLDEKAGCISGAYAGETEKKGLNGKGEYKKLSRPEAYEVLKTLVQKNKFLTERTNLRKSVLFAEYIKRKVIKSE